MTNDISHPLPQGSTAILHHLVLAQRPGIVARAEIVSPIDGEPDVYRVRLWGEKTDRIELVHAGLFQDHARLCLAGSSRQWEWQQKRAAYCDLFRKSNISRRPW